MEYFLFISSFILIGLYENCISNGTECYRNKMKTAINVTVLFVKCNTYVRGFFKKFLYYHCI